MAAPTPPPGSSAGLGELATASTCGLVTSPVSRVILTWAGYSATTRKGNLTQ
jgi:hypothetical protein